jgi:hypothetical protein
MTSTVAPSPMDSENKHQLRETHGDEFTYRHYPDLTRRAHTNLTRLTLKKTTMSYQAPRFYVIKSRVAWCAFFESKNLCG